MFWLRPGWYKVFGFSLLTLRSLSITFGALVLFAWYAMMCRLSLDFRIALLAVGLLAVDYHFLSFAALGRMDAMCAGLGWAGCAAYVCLRERNLKATIFLANTLVAASCFTHPCGVLYFTLLSVLTLYYDRSRLGLGEMAVAVTPYLVGLAGWGAYILQSPAQFWSQFAGNISGIGSEYTQRDRWSGLRNPFAAFLWEVRRYLGAFHWYVATSFRTRFQVSILALYLLGAAIALCTPSLRRKPGNQVLLLAGSLFFFLLAVFEGMKSSPYIVHTFPIAAALLAVSFASFLWPDQNGYRSPWIRGAAAAVLAAFLCIQFFYGIQDNRNPREQWDYAATVGFLKNHAGPSSQIVGGGELAFQFGFDANLIDDPRLGYYSGKQPDFIVANDLYRAWFKRSESRYPEIFHHIERVLGASYREVFHNASYTVYRRVVD